MALSEKEDTDIICFLKGEPCRAVNIFGTINFNL